MDKEPVFDFVGFLFASIVKCTIVLLIGSIFGEAGTIIAGIYCIFLVTGTWHNTKEKYQKDVYYYKKEKGIIIV